MRKSNKSSCFSRARIALRSIEQLESRLAPATWVNPATLTYQDVDGDHVTVALTKPLLSSATVADSVFAFNTGGVNGDNSVGQQLETIDLTKLTNLAAASGASIKVTATKSPQTGGDGFANVGLINATGINLATVSVKGDLGKILAGAGTPTPAGLASLSVQSMGRFGASTQAGGGDLLSTVTGALGSISVKSDIDGASIFATTTIGAVTVGGSIIGGTAAGTGQISSGGDIGTVRVGGDLVGTNGAVTGEISSGGKLGRVTVGGSLLGGSGPVSGEIDSRGDMDMLTVGGSLMGGGGAESGAVDCGGKLAGAKVGGALWGGSAPDTGEILSRLDMGQVTVGGDLRGGSAADSGDISAGGKIASATIAGSLIGGAGSDSGEILSGLDMGPVNIGGMLFGGTGSDSGDINCGGALTSVSVKGSLLGGSQGDTGEIISRFDIGQVAIGGDVLGGSGDSSGDITSGGNLAGIAIGGSMVGGAGASSGLVIARKALGSVTVRGNLVGGSISGAGAISLDESGYIQGQRIAKLTIGGSVISGSNTATNGATLTHSGSIRAVDDLGPISVTGSLMGNSTNPVVISARGQAKPTPTSDLAIASLTVNGRVESAEILAGYDIAGNPVNGEASIGKVKVAGDWIASNLVAGAATADQSLNFGTATDIEIAGTDNPEDRIARIAGITIGGQALGTVGGADHFGLVAEQIGSLQVGGTTFTLKIGASNDGPLTVGATGDLTLFEVP